MASLSRKVFKIKSEREQKIQGQDGRLSWLKVHRNLFLLTNEEPGTILPAALKILNWEAVFHPEYMNKLFFWGQLRLTESLPDELQQKVIWAAHDQYSGVRYFSDPLMHTMATFRIALMTVNSVRNNWCQQTVEWLQGPLTGLFIIQIDLCGFGSIMTGIWYGMIAT